MKDLLLYILISIGVVAMLVLIAHFHVSHAVFIRWGGLGLGTLILYGGFISHSRQLLNKWLFWVLTGAALILHLGLFITILSFATEWKLTWFMAMLLEVPALLYIHNRLSQQI